MAANKKKSVSKAKAKKPVKKSAPVKKAAPKKSTAPKKAASPAKKSKAPQGKATKSVASPALVRPSAAPKLMDLKNFFTPLDDRLIIQVSEVERKTAGGLFIPDTVGDISGNLEGFVLAAGRGHRDSKGRVRPMDVQVGDRVVFSQYSGDKMEIHGQNVIILREGDVMGIMAK